MKMGVIVADRHERELIEKELLKSDCLSERDIIRYRSHLVKCPECGFYLHYLTKTHCRLVHGMEREEVLAREAERNNEEN